MIFGTLSILPMPLQADRHDAEATESDPCATLARARSTIQAVQYVHLQRNDYS